MSGASIRKGHEVIVPAKPQCDICKHEGRPDVPAEYDGKTDIGGRWAYMCQSHFDVHGFGTGVGIGQKLVLAERDAPAVRLSDGTVAATVGDMDDLHNA